MVFMILCVKDKHNLELVYVFQCVSYPKFLRQISTKFGIG